MDLSQLRQQIDTIDRQIVNLYEERMDVSRQVAEYKIEGLLNGQEHTG